MYCPYCGKSNEDGSVFCEHCGKSLVADLDEERLSGSDWDDREDRTDDGPHLAGGGKKAALIAVAVVAVVVILVAVFATGAGAGGEARTQGSSGTASEDSQSSGADGGQEEESAGAEEHRIVFETSGGTAYEPLTAAAGDVVTSPTEPVKSNAVFEGWYSDQGLTMQVSFPYTVKDTDPETIILYAKWRNLDSVFADGTTSNNSRIGNGSAGNGQSAYYANCIFPYSSSEYLTEAEVRGLSNWQIQRAINEIFARNGFIFQKSAEEKAFFESQSWYHGTETDQTIVQSRFNDIECANVRLLTSYR